MKLFRRTFGEGTPVVILHGLFGSSDNWQTFAKNLASHQCKVITVDLRNHGLSPHSQEFNFEALASDINDLFIDEGIVNATIIGHSLGGKTAMTFSYQHPELIKQLIVIDIAPRFYEVHHRKILDTLISVNFNKIESRRDVELILASGITDKGTQQFLLKNLYRKEKDQFAWRFNLAAINSHIEEVGRATYPSKPFQKQTLFIKGEKSNYISYDDEREIFEHFTDVEIRNAPNAGHWVHADNPEWLLEEVARMVRGGW